MIYTINDHTVEADFDVLDNRGAGNSGLDQVIVLAHMEIDDEPLDGMGSLVYQNVGDGNFDLLDDTMNNDDERRSAYERLTGRDEGDIDWSEEDWREMLQELLSPVTTDVQAAYEEAGLDDYVDPLIADLADGPEETDESGE